MIINPIQLRFPGFKLQHLRQLHVVTCGHEERDCEVLLLMMCRSTSDLSLRVWIDFFPNYWMPAVWLWDYPEVFRGHWPWKVCFVGGWWHWIQVTMWVNNPFFILKYGILSWKKISCQSFIWFCLTWTSLNFSRLIFRDLGSSFRIW